MMARAVVAALFIGLWLAVAFIVEAVERPVSAKGETSFFINGVSCNLYFNTKFGSMPYRVNCENSIVFGPSPHISVRSSFSNLMHCCNCNRQLAAVPLQTRSNHNSLCAAIIWECEIVWKIASINGKPRVDTSHSMFCWGIAAILPNRKEYPLNDFLCLLFSSPKMLDPFAKNERPLGHNEGFSAERNLVSGSVGCAFGDGDRSLHIAGLIRPDFFHRLDGLFEAVSLPAKYDQLKNQNYGRRYADENRDPIIPTLFAFVASVLVGFLLVLFGGERFDNKRRVQGAALIGFGLLLALLGVGLWLYGFLRDAPDVF